MSKRNPDDMSSEITVETRTSIHSETSRQPLRVVVVDNLRDLALYEESWNQLANSTKHGQPILSYAWIASWLETQIQPDQLWKCFFVLRGEKLICARPLIATEMTFLGLSKHRIVPPNDLHTPSTDLLCHSEDAKEVADTLISAIAKTFPKLYCYGHPRIPENSPAVELYRQGYRNGSPILEPLDAAGYLTIGENFDDYLKSLSSSFLRNLRRLERKLSDLDAITEFIVDPARNLECLERFMKVEASGWKKEHGGAIKLDPQLVKFYTILTERLAKLGWLEWQFIEAEGKTIAAQMGVRCGHVLNLMKIAYDESYSSYAPSSMLFIKTIRRAYEIHPYDEINFQSSGSWLKNWAVSDRKYYNLTVYPRTPVSFFRGYVPRRLRAAVRNNPWLMSLYRKLRERMNGNGAKPNTASADSDEN